ncbi:MAG TPA: c-type cytochrome [Gemmataceae bacterium]
MNLLGHDNPIFRAWAVRFLGGSRDAGEPTVTGFQSCAKAEKDPTVRRELAAAARTLGERYNTSLLLHALMQHKEDARDPVIPQMIWLAYHSQLAANAKPELDWLAANAPGNPLITDHIVGKAMRRLVATGKPEDLAACVAFLGAVRDTAVREKGLEGLTTALENRQIDPPPEWRAVRAELAKETDPDIRRMVARLSVNFRDRQAMRRALEVAQNLRHPVEERRNAVQDLALVHPPEARAALLGIALGDKEPAELRVEAVRALAGYGQPEISDKLLAGWKSYPPALKDEVVRLLAGRREWARDLLAAVGEKRVARTELTDNTILRIRAFRDRGLNELIEKVWGRYRETPEELGKLIARVRGSLDKGRASFARGRKVFETHCAKCHQFDGTGHEVGPRLDGAERSIDYLLANVLDPNRVVGAPYFMRTVELQSGRIESGLLAEENDQAVTLKLENGVRKVIPRSEIAAVLVNEKSVMPEGLAENMTEQDVRDLIRYVMANPFLTDVTVRLSPAGPGGKEEVIRPEVGPSGRIELPGAKGERKAVIEAEVSAPEEMKTRLLLGSSADVEVRVNGGPEVRKPATGDEAEPDRASVDAALRKGVNRVTIALEYEGNGPVVYARFLDPERKLRYAD